MFCAFEGSPRIVRLLGKAEILFPSSSHGNGEEDNDEEEERKKELLTLEGEEATVVFHVDLVGRSCGYAVPFLRFLEEEDESATMMRKQANEMKEMLLLSEQRANEEDEERDGTRRRTLLLPRYEELSAFVRENSQIFIVGTAGLDRDHRVNVSPKGQDCLVILEKEEEKREEEEELHLRLAYLDFFGSGVQTISHLKQNGRMSLLFWSPKRTILLLHGRGEALEFGTSKFKKRLANSFRSHPLSQHQAVRSIIEFRATSFELREDADELIPPFEIVGPRDTLLHQHFKDKDRTEILVKKRQQNSVSIDGLEGCRFEDADAVEINSEKSDEEKRKRSSR